ITYMRGLVGSMSAIATFRCPGLTVPVVYSSRSILSRTPCRWRRMVRTLSQGLPWAQLLQYGAQWRITPPASTTLRTVNAGVLTQYAVIQPAVSTTSGTGRTRNRPCCNGACACALDTAGISSRPAVHDARRCPEYACRVAPRPGAQRETAAL